MTRTLCVLRLSRLSRTPPALYSTKELVAQGLKVLAVEYGNVREPVKEILTPIHRWRIANPWVRFLPSPMRGAAIFLGTCINLLFRFSGHSRPALFYTHGISEQVMALCLGTLLRVPWVCHVHEVYDPNEVRGFNRVLLLLEGLALRRAQWLIFPERDRAELYRKRYQLNVPIEIVFNCPPKISIDSVETHDLRSQLNLSNNTVLLGYFGGIGRWNCLEDGIRAVARSPKTHFLIWGWGDRHYLDKLQELAKGVGCRERVHFMGELSDDKWKAIAELDISYCVYQPEVLRLKNAATASNKLMESIACGVPVITGPTPDFRSIVEQHEVGIAISEFSVQAIFEALDTLGRNEVLRKKMSQKGIDLHAGSFHFESCFEPVLRRFLSQLSDSGPTKTIATSTQHSALRG